MLAGLPPRVIASERSSAATGKVAEQLATTPPAPAPTSKDAAPELAVVAAPPPLPRRKPEEEPQTETVAALPAAPQDKAAKPAAPVVAPEASAARREATEPRAKSQWQPMALAPADKPAIAAVPTARPTSGAYASKVWSALARHKPRAGQSGSALVMFAIGENGGLRGLKIGRSSGNARIDQLALATVRGAAPFPPPPSGTASYSIRIDFH
jgi:protein TonB